VEEEDKKIYEKVKDYYQSQSFFTLDHLKFKLSDIEYLPKIS